MHGSAGFDTSAVAADDVSSVMTHETGNTPRANRPRRWAVRLFGAFLIAVGALVFFSLSSSPADATELEIFNDCWSPNSTTVGICGAGSPDVRVDDPITVYGDISGCGFIDGGCTEIGSAPWQMQVRLDGPTDGPSTVTASTSTSNGRGGGYIAHG